MKKSFILFACALLLTRCELVDPTQGVINPNLTLEAVLGTPNPAVGWTNGLYRQNALVYNNLVTLLEIGSDNYVNTRTFYNQQFDKLNILYQDGNINTLQFSLADLRESAKLGLGEVRNNDPDITPGQIAEFHFFKGWAQLLAGEIFVALPNEPGGRPLTPAENLQAAIADFQAAEALVPDNAGYKLALARAYYGLGNKTNAALKANEALALSQDFLRSVVYDANNLPTNTMQDALFDRGTFDDLQPLPRLDFLDPKYYGRSASVESPIYFQKAEEAHLILAEIALSDNNLTAARTHLKNCIALVDTRTISTFSDGVEGRTHLEPGSRPDQADVEVRASAADPYRTGLVLDRAAATVSVPTVSGTSVTDAIVDALTTADELLETLYLMRQEIFIAEGRRFTDLGIKVPISENEKLLNAAVTDAHILSHVPSFVPVNMDEITYDKVNKQCTITHNMNKILVANKTSTDVLPFH